MGNRWKGEIPRTILNIFRPYNGIDVLQLPFLEELYEKTFVVLYVAKNIQYTLVLSFMLLISITNDKILRL